MFGDRIDTFGATEQVVTDGSRGFYIEGYLFPVRRPALEDLTRRTIRAVGLTDAGFSIEFRGETVIEINARLGEDEGFLELFSAGLGVPPILKWIRGDATPSRVAGGHALAYRNCLDDAVVTSVPTTSAATILARPGTRYFAPPHPDMSAAPRVRTAIAPGRRARRLRLGARRRGRALLHARAGSGLTRMAAPTTRGGGRLLCG